MKQQNKNNKTLYKNLKKLFNLGIKDEIIEKSISMLTAVAIKVAVVKYTTHFHKYRTFHIKQIKDIYIRNDEDMDVIKIKEVILKIYTQFNLVNTCRHLCHI